MDDNRCRTTMEPLWKKISLCVAFTQFYTARQSRAVTGGLPTQSLLFNVSPTVEGGKWIFCSNARERQHEREGSHVPKPGAERRPAMECVFISLTGFSHKLIKLIIHFGSMSTSLAWPPLMKSWLTLRKI